MRTVCQDGASQAAAKAGAVCRGAQTNRGTVGRGLQLSRILQPGDYGSSRSQLCFRRTSGEIQERRGLVFAAAARGVHGTIQSASDLRADGRAAKWRNSFRPKAIADG